MKIRFNYPFSTGREIEYIQQAMKNGRLSGNGPFTKKCQSWIEQFTGSSKVLLTHSCTAALEMAAILAGIQPGDEIIMPSYTFVSTANAFVLRGGVPVFVDIRPDTLNINETKIEAAITDKTKAIVPVHYAGVGCEMDTIMDIAERYQLLVIEDAAQAFMASYNGRSLGAIGHLAAVSFHETKNVISAEGGALLINDDRFCERAEIIWEKGTNRSQFFRGEVNKYSWMDIGSSFLPSELVAAFLWAQLEEAEEITKRRLKVWARYNQGLCELEDTGFIRRPFVPESCAHNAHMYYLLVENPAIQERMLARLKKNGIHAVFHYIPLHSSPAGRQFGRVAGSMSNTDEISRTIVRLPLWIGLKQSEIDVVVKEVYRATIKK